jgi:hypothetical protein
LRRVSHFGSEVAGCAQLDIDVDASLPRSLFKDGVVACTASRWNSTTSRWSSSSRLIPPTKKEPFGLFATHARAYVLFQEDPMHRCNLLHARPVIVEQILLLCKAQKAHFLVCVCACICMLHQVGHAKVCLMRLDSVGHCDCLAADNKSEEEDRTA